MKKHGFTLVEIIVTAAIIGILTAIALPSFVGSINRSYAQDALNNLMTIYAAEQNYNLNHGGTATNYLTCADLTCINNNDPDAGLNLNIVNSGDMSYACNASVSPPVCTATKTGVFVMTLTLTQSVSVQSSARYCSGSSYNPCCNGGTAGAKCP